MNIISPSTYNKTAIKKSLCPKHFDIRNSLFICSTFSSLPIILQSTYYLPMKSLIGCLLLLVVMVSCSKSKDVDPVNTPQNPVVTSYSPSNPTTGDQLTISGHFFGKDLSAVTVKLDSTTLVIQSVNDSTVVVFIPASRLSSGQRTYTLSLYINGRVSNTLTIGVAFAVHGWRYVSPSLDILNRLPLEQVRKIAFSDPNRGMITGTGIVASSVDGGTNWGGVFNGGSTLGIAMSVANEDHMWLEQDRFDLIYRDQHDPIFYLFNKAYLDTITTVPYFQGRAITGAYTYKPFRGYLLNQEGRVYKVNGSFRPQDISLEYTSSYHTTASSSSDVRFYSISALDSMNMVMAGWPSVYPNTKLVLIHKKNGVYSEYDLSFQLQYSIADVQLTDPNTVYILDGFYNLFKFTNGTQLVKLPVQAYSICFTSTQVGYAAAKDRIYKTTDGGQTWNTDFILRTEDYISAMCTLNGTVWAIGRSNGGSGNGFAIRYDP